MQVASALPKRIGSEIIPVDSMARVCAKRVMTQLFQRQQRKLCASRPLQRPVIQQQQNHGQRHQHRLAHQAHRKQKHHKPISGKRPGTARITDISRDGEHEEQPAEDILALGHPGDGFNPQGMDGKHRRYKRAAPKGARHPAQN
jgi:hypothetical protein